MNKEHNKHTKYGLKLNQLLNLQCIYWCNVASTTCGLYASASPQVVDTMSHQ